MEADGWFIVGFVILVAVIGIVIGVSAGVGFGLFLLSHILQKRRIKLPGVIWVLVFLIVSAVLSWAAVYWFLHKPGDLF